MTQTTARVTKDGKHFEVIVDMDKALAYKKGDSNAVDFLETDTIFHNSKNGDVASGVDVKKSFGTEDINEVAGQIVKYGEVLVTQEVRSAEQEQKFKQVVDFIVTNAIDSKTGNPHTPERIENAMKEAHVNIKNKSVEEQASEAIVAISKIIPIKIETKKVKITVPAMHTGKVYGIVNQYKESEEWKDNGDLEIIVNVPAGMIMDFYDKLNDVTHGSALTEDLKGDERE